MNSQDIVKRHLRTDGLVDVFNIFGPTFQGEGPFVGTPCFFIRLAECNLRCPGCDTVYSESHPSRPKKRGLMCPMEITKELQELGWNSGLVIISGGEPMRQNIAPLIEALLSEGYYVQIETNGTLPPRFPMDKTGRESIAFYNKRVEEHRGCYIVVSPKTGKVHELYNVLACAFKYVGAFDDLDPDDGLPVHVLHHTVKGRVARPDAGYAGLIYLQPMDYNELATVNGISDSLRSADARYFNGLATKAVLESCYKHGYIFGMQLHKIVGCE